jgi:hypothetical protein
MEDLHRLWGDEKVMKLMGEILAGNIVNIRPELDFATEMGFSYPSAEQILGLKSKEVVPVLESLVDKGVLRKDFFDRLLRCPQCRSLNLTPTTHCPKCASGNILRGRILEHFACKYVGPEDEFLTKGKYLCPNCKQELRISGSDYQSLGLLRKCRDCGEVFNVPLIKWRCIKCASIAGEDKVTEVNIYSYSFNEEKRAWLEFESQPKTELIEFLRHLGYEVTEGATMKGNSGAEHSIDILATRDDGVTTHHVAIGVEVVGDRVELQEVFDFDDKAYDIGIHDKILVVIPSLSREAEKFAANQRIKVLQVRDLEAVLAGGAPKPDEEIHPQPFEFKSRSALIQYLKQRGYQVKEYAEVKGKSGAKHTFDLLATKDDGIVAHNIAIGIEVAADEVELDRLFHFDDKCYDIGIPDKVFIAVPALSREAKQFAERQRIRVFEVPQLEPLS